MPDWILTPRDTKILELASQGKNNREIAKELGMKITAVQRRMRIMRQGKPEKRKSDFLARQKDLEARVAALEKLVYSYFTNRGKILERGLQKDGR